MVKKSLIIIFALCAIGYISTGCTSHSSDNAEQTDNPEEQLDADSGNTNDDAVADLGDDSTANSDQNAGSDQLAPDEKLPDDSSSADAAAPDAPSTADGADAGLDQSTADNGTPPADASTDQSAANNPAEPSPEPVAPGGDTTADNSAPPADASADTAAPAPTPEPSAPEAPPAPAPSAAIAPLQKIKSAPYQQNKTWVNAVYIARQNDDPKSISQKIYGSEDHVKQICRINAHNCSRATKVGDKFYYNSPKRPDDHDTLKTFYEDAGVQAETYIAKDGDNIRKVGKQLLGSDRSWMELWATNPDVESKGELPAGTQLKYWPNTDVAAPAQTVATNEDQSGNGDDLADGGAQGDQPQPAAQAANSPPPPPPPPPQQNDQQIPPPPPQNANSGAAAANVAPPPPEPPPPPPPPPPPMEKHQVAPAAADSSMDDPNQTMALGVGAILLLAAVFLVISIRKKRKNKIDYNTATQTQIDS